MLDDKVYLDNRSQDTKFVYTNGLIKSFDTTEGNGDQIQKQKPPAQLIFQSHVMASTIPRCFGADKQDIHAPESSMYLQELMG